MSASEVPSRESLRGRVGTTLKNKWHLDELLDVGGMAAIYAATHPNGARAAIKLLHDKFSNNSDVCQRFLREGYVANAVDHPGAVAVIDDERTESGAPFLVMELLSGMSLHDRLEDRGKLPPEEVLYIVDQVLDVLIAAHDKAIVHRDIKPANVFLTRDGRVKLLDFGLARMEESKFNIDPTRDGMVLGTPSFSSPEQARGQNDMVDWRSDIWGVGALAYNSLTGKHVHDEPTTLKRLMAAATRPAPSLALLAPELPGELVALVDTALAFDKEKRFQTARLMQEATRRVFYVLSGGAAPGSEVTTDRLSWADIPQSGERVGYSQASITLMSPQEASGGAASIDIIFEEPVRVVELAKKPSAEPTMTSPAPDTEQDDDLVTDSMILEAPRASDAAKTDAMNATKSTEPSTTPTDPPTEKKQR